MRLIDADAMIDRLKEWDTNDKTDKALYNFTLNRINEQPTIQPEPHWIPCSERLPKYGKNVLITNDKGNVRYGRFRGVEFWKEDGDSYWTWKQNTIEHVLAWMPLSEPYKDGEQHE